MRTRISTQRLEALSDGVIAIIITIIVLGVPLPDSLNSEGILKLLGTFFIYFISFIVVGSFWNQHNHIFSYINQIANMFIWFNLMFLFFLSLIPIMTKWVMENPGELTPAIGYNVVYLLVNFTYVFIFGFVIHNSEKEEILKLRTNKKKLGKSFPNEFLWLRFIISAIIILISIILAIYIPRLSTVFLLALPVASSLANLLFEGSKHGKHNNRSKKTEQK